MALLELRDVSVDFDAHGSGFGRAKSTFRAVSSVSLSLEKGRTLALVGESGSGKTTLGQVALGLLNPSEGSVLWKGRSLGEISRREMRKVRADFGLISQDPSSALNPRLTVFRSVALPLRIHSDYSGSDVRAEVHRLLERVGLIPPQHYANKYPHQISGGQRQRVAVARAIALEPDLIVADEPVSSLDVSLSGGILNLLTDLQNDMGVALLFISHDLGVVQAVAHDVAVMYAGTIVERGSVAEVMTDTTHPYTQLLISSIPEVMASAQSILLRNGATNVKESKGNSGKLGPPSDVEEGCIFASRCPYAWDLCTAETPSDFSVEGTSHEAACHLVTLNDGVPEDWILAKSQLARVLSSG